MFDEGPYKCIQFKNGSVMAYESAHDFIHCFKSVDRMKASAAAPQAAAPQAAAPPDAENDDPTKDMTPYQKRLWFQLSSDVIPSQFFKRMSASKLGTVKQITRRVKEDLHHSVNLPVQRFTFNGGKLVLESYPDEDHWHQFELNGAKVDHRVAFGSLVKDGVCTSIERAGLDCIEFNSSKHVIVFHREDGECRYFSNIAALDAAIKVTEERRSKRRS